MIDHLELRSRRVEAVRKFYADLLGPLGYEQRVDNGVKGFGDGVGLDFFIAEGEPSRDVHFAFRSPTRSLVDEIFEKGRAEGYDLDRAPAVMPQIHPNYYAGFVRDPDGRLVEFVCHESQ